MADIASRPDAAAKAPVCESARVSIDDLRPTITLLVDQSGSMTAAYPNRNSPNTRWSLVHDALLDPDTGVIKKLQYSLRFGIAFFTSHNGSSSGTCPIISEIRAATNNYEAIRTLYDRMSPDDDTPTGDSIDQIVKDIEASPSRGPQVILLVTDGQPDTCAEPDPQNGQPQAILASQKAYRAGIDLYVMGISNDISGQNLQELANAGKGVPVDWVYGQDKGAGQPFEASESVEGLTGQFVDILKRVPLCEVRLRRDVDATEVSRGRVELDGKALTYGDDNGFKLADPRRLMIVGFRVQRHSNER